MQLSNERYDQIKWFVTTFLPALSTLIAGMATLLGWPNGTLIVGIIALFTTFLGSIMNISTSSYEGDGQLIVDTSNPDKDIYSIAIDDYPSVLANKNTVMLKVKHAEEEPWQ